MNDQYIGYNVTALIGLRLELNTSNGKEVVSLYEGDMVTNLVYQDGNELRKISGRVIAIEYKETSNYNNYRGITAESFNSPDKFSERFTISAIRIDASDRYHSDIRKVYIDNIREIEGKHTCERMEVSEVSLLNDCEHFIIRFRPSEPPVLVLDSTGKEAELIDNADGTFSIIIRKMTEYLRYMVIGANSMAVIKMDGLEPIKIANSIISNKMVADFPLMVNMYENKYNSGDIIIPDEDLFYIPVMKQVTAPEEIVFEIPSKIQLANEVTYTSTKTYTKDEEIKVSIGNNAFLVDKAFKMIGNKLAIATPLLMAYGMMAGKVKLVVNGWEEEIEVPKVVENELGISNVGVIGTVEGYVNTAEVFSDRATGEITIKHVREHGTSAVVYDLLDSESNKLPLETKIFAIKRHADGKIEFGISRVDTEKYSYGHYNYWLNGPITEPLSRDMDVTIIAPEYGYANVLLDIDENVK